MAFHLTFCSEININSNLIFSKDCGSTRTIKHLKKKRINIGETRKPRGT